MTTIANLNDLRRGDDFAFQVTYTDDGDLSAAAISATWRDEEDAVVFTRRNLAAGGDATQIAVTNGPAGIFVVYVVPANTAAVLARTGATRTLRYDVQITTAAGIVHTALEGIMRVIGDATR